MAEAYWDLEWELQQQGFDYCYDKRLYDRMEHGDVEPVRQHLQGDPEFERRLVRFLENHDEPQSRCDVSAGQASRGGGGDSFTPGRQAASRRPIPGATNESDGVSRAAAGGNSGSRSGALLRDASSADRRGAISERRLDAVRMCRLAGQYELSESAGLVLEKTGRAMPRDRQLFRRLRPGACPGSMVRGGYRNVAVDGCFLRAAV